MYCWNCGKERPITDASPICINRKECEARMEKRARDFVEGAEEQARLEEVAKAEELGHAGPTDD